MRTNDTGQRVSGWRIARSDDSRRRRLRVLVQFWAALVFLLAFAGTSFAGSISLAWDASASGDAAGYIVLYGTTPGTYTRALDVGNQTSTVVRGLAGGQTYNFVVMAYTSEGGVSVVSNAASGSTTNTPPILLNPGTQINGVGDSVSLSLSATDADGDPLFYDTTGLLSELQVDRLTGLITGTLSLASAGTHSVTAILSDGNSTAEQDFTWTVITTDRSPVMSVIPDQGTLENTPVSLAVSASDPDGNTLTFTAIGLPPGLTIDSQSGAISGSTSSIAGIYHVKVTASDGTLTASRVFNWTVDGASPVLLAIPDQTSSEHTTVSLPVSATDADGDALTFGATGLPPGLTIGLSSGIIGGSLSYSSAGTHNVTVTATDGALTVSRSFTWTVINVDRPPVVASMGHLSTLTGATIAIQASATDPDDDPVTYSALGLPAGVTIDTNTGLISGASALADVYNVTVSASDGTVSASRLFVWTVTVPLTERVTFMQARSSAVHNATETVSVSYPAAQTAGSLNAVVVNWDNPTVQISSVTDSKGNTYQLAAGPATRPEIGSQSIYYAANVGAAASATNVVTVTFNGGIQKAEVRIAEYQGIEPANVVDAIAGAQGNGGEADSGTATTTYRNDLLFGAVWSSWETVTSPEGGLTARLTTPSGTLLEDTTVTAVGSYNVRASIAPPNPWIIQMVAFRDVNHAPTLTPPPQQSGHTDAPVTLSLSASDADADPLTFNASGLPVGVSINHTTGVISGTPTGTATVIYNTTVSVSDGVLTTNAQFFWTVNAPTVSASTNLASTPLFNPGGSPSVIWDSILTPTPTDWIGLFTQGAADTAATIWWRITGTSSGSLAVTLPTTLAPGTYELRLFANATFRRLAASGPITVAAPTLNAGPLSLGPGATVTAMWSGIGSATSTDWVTLAMSGSADSSYVAWGYTNGSGSGSRGLVVPPNATPGTYELRLFAQNSMRRLAFSNTIIVEGTTVTAGPAALAPGGTLTINWSGIGVPSATDWVVLAPAGAADTAYVAWGYTNGASAGSRTLTVPKTAVPGPYQVRLLANNTFKRLAVGNTFTVLPVTLAASPSTLAPGGTLTLSWQNIGVTSNTDWFVLVPVNAADGNWVAWIYGTGRANDSTLFTIPNTLAAGNYEVRMFANNTFKHLAFSNPITITAAGPTLATSPVSTAPGGTLTASWRNIAAPTSKDWVGLYTVGATDASYVTKTYTNGRTTDRMAMTLPDNLSTGSYELRLFANDTLTLLATSNGFEVTANARVSGSPLTVKAGGTLNVAWAGIAAPTTTDWVGLIPVNGADNAYVAWRFTNGAASGSVGLTIPATVASGTYELRLFAHNTFQRLAIANFIKVGPTLTANPTPVAPGGTLTLAWAGIATPTAGDWMALVPLAAADNQWVAWIYTDSTATGSKSLVIPTSLAPGVYDVRLFANNTFTRLALSNVITITAPGPSIGVQHGQFPLTYSPGSSAQAVWKGITAPTLTDWIGLYQSGAADGAFISRVYTGGIATSGSTSFLLPVGLAPGQYELRLFSNDTQTRLAVGNSFTIQ